ncbi:E3 ubiquitin-protein ligase RSL1 [Cardamine amara subsp. amara]|uniref:RBR-type E3 ubiquitin transferase n=1 Tax=Cardamine amara subsp. amara TaxID=228776 RepID=A0ABD1APM9_CARAN
MQTKYMEEEDSPNPAGKSSPRDITSDSYLYFKGMIREGTRGLIAGFGIVICREGDDNLLFQMKGSLHDPNITVLEAELMALKLGLFEAVSLGIDHISIYCDNEQIFELVMGRSMPEQENIAKLMDGVEHIRQLLKSSIPVLVTGNQTKKTCGICFDNDIKAEKKMFSNALCNHQFCVECMKQHIEVRLTEGGVPRCPHYGCQSNLTLGSCVHLLTPKLREIWELRIKEDSIPVCDRFHCPNPRCWALMSKTELFESTQEDGVRRCCFKCHKPFCINCKVPWHSNLSCDEYKTLSLKPSTTLRRQCRKCQHMI